MPLNKPFYVTDNFVEWVKASQFEDPIIMENIDIVLEFNIANDSILAILIHLILNKFRNRTDRGSNYNYDSVVNHFLGEVDTRSIIRGIDYSVDVDISQLTVFDRIELSSNREYFRRYTNQSDNTQWGLHQRNLLTIAACMSISNRYLPVELREELKEPLVNEVVLETSQFLRKVKKALDTPNRPTPLTMEYIQNRSNEVLQENLTRHNETRGRLLDRDLQRHELSRRILELEMRISNLPRGQSQIVAMTHELNNLKRLRLNTFRGENDIVVRQFKVCSSCQNMRTPINLENTSNKDILFISYKFEDKTVCYTVEELTGCFSPFGENNNFYEARLFKDDTFVEIPMEDIDQLYLLVCNLLRTNDNTDLHDLKTAIMNLKEAKRSTSQYEIRVQATYQTFTEDVKDIIKEYLKEFFYTGMYMRRWLGPGFPLPLSENETLRSNFSPEERVAPHLNTLTDLMEKLELMNEEAANFLKGLMEVQHYNVSELISHDKTHTVLHLFNLVNSGNYCIRMASTFFIGTGAFYMRLFDNYTFEGYDMIELMRIS